VSDWFKCPNCGENHAGPDGYCLECETIKNDATQAAYKLHRWRACSYYERLPLDEKGYLPMVWACTYNNPPYPPCAEQYSDCPLHESASEAHNKDSLHKEKS
jgi:hypothetical protein